MQIRVMVSVENRLEFIVACSVEQTSYQ